MSTNTTDAETVTLPTDPAALLTEAQAAYLVGVSKFTLKRRRAEGGDVPRFVKFGGRAIRYRRLDVELWIEQHAVA